ncbi:helicase-related protein [Spirulina sp. CCNP1310]|uniref:helicase-related protein n=1 Tax=Spirulina sp. CCNP1310 TaxID=3110249 RepID=UPI002B1F49DD|nr:helicase-related protein [Spirulina sp. CCNP1310]MEA5420496.1 helicase-related protein [Spirulina sp. CCNP1310]
MAVEMVSAGQAWGFDGDGALLRLVVEAHRIRYAYLFDPLIAVHTARVEPLPHQITAVYREMLPRQPLRFLLADDPGAGKTIMAGLLMRELLIRGDLQRCLIVCPGSLAAQWQEELADKFDLPFAIALPERPLRETPLAIARLDQFSRSEELQNQLQQMDWDLVVVDEAHKLAATVFGGERRETKRYKLGKLLATVSRHFLLMTATPHNGKEEDFQLFLALLDGDRFAGGYRDPSYTCDPADLMRRLVKEDLLKFDGTPLFPERRAHTVQYQLSPPEAELYRQVTNYVQREFDRAEALNHNGRKSTVGFALTILQRRLASSPEAIYQSLRRRRDRLQARLTAARQGQNLAWQLPPIDLEDWEEDGDEMGDEEREATEAAVVEQATAARTIAELQKEIQQLEALERLALGVRQGGRDRKWDQLSQLIQTLWTETITPKLVIFTEHRDTLDYLTGRITTLLGRPEAVVLIHGGMGRPQRRKAEQGFKQEDQVQVLIATDAAGEGINLQRAHLMVNYDLPWNPNRLEQRFGRIHRIGQREVCHLWNLVAQGTREGDVYGRLLEKLAVVQAALGGKVFDVLGKAVTGRELRELMMEAIRYGERPDVKARLNQVLGDRLNPQYLEDLLHREALAHDRLNLDAVATIRADMARAGVCKMQPYVISHFFLTAFEYLGGTIRHREAKRYEITHIPALIRAHPLGQPLPRRYERVCFEKDLITIPNQPTATLISPGHPLLEAILAVILAQEGAVLRRGAVLIDEQDPGEEVRAVVYLAHAIQESGAGRVISQRLQFVEITAAACRDAGPAPDLDYRPATAAEWALIEPLLPTVAFLADLEQRGLEFAIRDSVSIAPLVPQHLAAVQRERQPRLEKTILAVRDRLTKEINYWDRQAAKLRSDEEAGKTNAKLNSERAQQRADELALRLKERLAELEREQQLEAGEPVVLGGFAVIPLGLLQRLAGQRQEEPGLFARETRRVELAAMAAVMARERELGYLPRDVSAQKRGYDIESEMPATGDLRFIEVKGRIIGAQTVTVTRNEIVTALNDRERFLLALVAVPPGPEFGAGDVFRMRETGGQYGVGCEVRYVRQPFNREPDAAVNSVNYDWRSLWERGADR